MGNDNNYDAPERQGLSPDELYCLEVIEKFSDNYFVTADDVAEDESGYTVARLAFYHHHDFLHGILKAGTNVFTLHKEIPPQTEDMYDVEDYVPAYQEVGMISVEDLHKLLNEIPTIYNYLIEEDPVLH